MSEIVDVIPYARFLGVRVERTAAGIECVLPFRQELVGNPALPAVHGGVIGAFLELACLAQLMDDDRELRRVPKPINFGVDYLRSAGPHECHARAEVVKLGRRVATVHVRAWQADRTRPVAAGNGKFLLAAPAPAEPS